MNPQGLLALLVISISVISSFGISYASTFSKMPLPATKPTMTANDTAVYKISKRRCGDCNDESFNFLYAHNIVRASLGEPVLGWSSDLEGYARWWADQRRGDCTLVHSFPDGDFKLGENIFWGGGSGWTPSDAVSDWAGEQRYYSYAANGCMGGHECLHYTQIVWRRTTSLGCARVMCDNGDVFITCNYYPPGNYEGERPY